MASWNKLEYDKLGEGNVSQPSNTIPTDANLTMTDESVDDEWSTLVEADSERLGFLVQNTSQSELSIRIKGANVTGTRLPGYGDSFSPDFRPEQAYEIKAAMDGSTFVLTVW